MSRPFASGGQSIGASASVPPMNIQNVFPLELGEEQMHVYVWLSPFTVYLKLSWHCLLIGYTAIQNKKLRGKKKSHNGKQFDKNLLEFQNSVVSDPLLEL